MTISEPIKQAIGIVAFALNVWGNLELTKQTNRGHVIRLCSNACWLIYSPLVGAWALFLNHCTFAGINVLGFYRWKHIEKKRLPERNMHGNIVEFERFMRRHALHLSKIDVLPQTQVAAFRLASKLWLLRGG